MRLLHDTAQNRYPVRSVSVWMSNGYGKPWHALHVRHSNGRWSTTVTNPHSGTVWLRAKVIDSHGNATITEVGRAYAVG